MDLGIKGKLALVTGGGRGIGRAIAMCLAREGARVAVVSRTEEDVKETVEVMGGRSAGHHGIVMDLSPDEAPGLLVKDLRANFGDPAIVVHNLGGTLGITDPFCSREEWRRVYRFNFEIAVELNVYLVPGMQKAKWGRVIHISSISAMENHGPATYCAMKAALTAYTRSFGGYVAADGVMVSAVLPGAVFTEKGYWDITSRERPEHVKKYLTERQRIGRFGKTDEIGNFVAFLCSQQASFNPGSVIPIDGGQGRGYFGQ
ncbi:MAG: SDR family oxidoreductase [Candidatus Omnitrophica bacterium]|nr:SDR family oxidoreductase [Candidatus Omnitrophota bacterium]